MVLVNSNDFKVVHLYMNFTHSVIHSMQISAVASNMMETFQVCTHSS